MTNGLIKPSEQLQQEIQPAQCSELQIMNDLSDAAHHRFLTWPNNPPRVVVQASAAFSLQSPTGGESVQLYISTYGPFLPAATKAVAFLAQLARLMTFSPIGLNVTEGRFRSYFVCGTTIDSNIPPQEIAAHTFLPTPSLRSPPTSPPSNCAEHRRAQPST